MEGEEETWKEKKKHMQAQVHTFTKQQRNSPGQLKSVDRSKRATEHRRLNLLI